MQAASITTTTALVGGADPSADATGTGQGIRISSSQRSRDSLFTAILQKGIAIGGVTGEAAVPENPGVVKKDAGNDTVDVCSLLMQLMMIGTQTQQTAIDGQQGSTPAAPQGVAVGQILQASGQQPGGVPAAMLDMLTSAPAPVPIDGIDQAAVPTTEMPGIPATVGTGADFRVGTVISGIAEALRENRAQGVSEVQTPAGQTDATAAAAGMVAPVATAEAQAVPGTAPESLPNVTGEQAIAAGKPAVGAQVVKSAVTDGPQEERGAPTEGTPDSAASPVVQNAGQITASPEAKASSDQNAGSKESGTSPELLPRGKDKEDAAAVPAVAQAVTTAAGARLYSVTLAEKTAAAEKALLRFEHDLRSLQSGTHEIKIVLEPESLGVLTISVTKTETGVSAKIKSEDREVVAAISDQLQKLISSMENKGIRLHDVDVVFSQTELSSGYSQNGFSQSGGGSPRGFSAATGQKQSVDAPSEELFNGFYGDISNGDTTVDYTV